jgi:FlaG/FlaF family flagellin (archaellin)
MFALPSCINDDLTQCETKNRVFFDYTPVTKAAKFGIDPDDVVKINLYVFSENGRFLKEYTDESPALSPSYHFNVDDLEPGRYRFIAWCNLGNQYELNEAKLTPGVTSIDALRTKLVDVQNDTVRDYLNPLFYATHTGVRSIEVVRLVQHDIHLKLTEDTYKINVEVAGLDSASALGNSFRVDITDSNSEYDFGNEWTSDRDITYSRPLIANKDKNYLLETSLMVLRLAASRDIPVIRLIKTNTDSEVVRANLIELLTKATQMGAEVDFDTNHEFDIRFEFDPNAPLECNVYVNGYRVIDQGGQILN